MSRAPNEAPFDERVTAHSWAVLILAGLATVLPSINLSVMYVVYPEIQAAFPDADDALMSWILNGYTITASATLVIGGVVADRWGRKRSLLSGCSVFGLASVVCALAPNVGTIVAGRVLMGISASFLVTANVSIALREFPLSRRPMAFGVLSSFGGLAAAAGPSLGSIVILGGWQWGFWLNVPIALVIVVGGWRIFDESRDPTVKHFPDVIGALCLLGGVGLGILVVVQSPTWGWLSATALGCLAVALLLLALLVLRSARHRGPIIDLQLFRRRNVTLYNLSAFLVSVGWFGMYFELVQFLRNVWDYGLLPAGLLVTPIPFGAGVLAPICGRYAERIGYRPMLIAGAGSFALGAVLFITLVGPDPNIAAWLVAIFPIAVGTGLVFPSVQAGSVLGTPSEQYAQAAGLNQTVQRIGSALGNAVAIAFIASRGVAGAFNPMFFVVLISSLVVVPIAWALPPLSRTDDASLPLRQ